MAKLLTVTIANGASLSGVVEIGGSKPVLIDVPAEVNCSSFSTGRVVQLPSQLEGVAFLKLRSGTAATPVNQGSARSLKLTAV
jgi:hypothetical protein